jgi:hypothetical protein
MMREMLRVMFTGDVGNRELASLRAALGMAARGRLSDELDDEFGWSELRPRAGGRVELTLLRSTRRDGLWMFRLTYEKSPLPAAELDLWEQKVTDAIAEAGLTVQSIRR